MTDSFLRYLQYEKRVSAHTLLAYENDLNQFDAFIRQDPDATLLQANHSLVRAWIIQLVDDKLEATSVNRKIASLRAYYKFLLKQELIERDPMMKIRPLKTRKRLPTFVKEDEMTVLLDNVAYANDLKGWRERLILELLYGTGIRVSELVNLKEDQVNFHARTIKVLGKRNKERVIPFSAGIVLIIEGYREARNREVVMNDHGLLFVTDKGEPCSRQMVYGIVHNSLHLNTKTEKRSPHVLRHTYATHLLNKGAEINAVKDLLGHASLAATQVYTHNSLDKLKKVFEQAHPKA